VDSELFKRATSKASFFSVKMLHRMLLEYIYFLSIASDAPLMFFFSSSGTSFLAMPNHHKNSFIHPLSLFLFTL